MTKGKLIVLNGGSTAEKSSVAQEFQELVPECWMHLGIARATHTDTEYDLEIDTTGSQLAVLAQELVAS